MDAESCVPLQLVKEAQALHVRSEMAALATEARGLMDVESWLPPEPPLPPGGTRLPHMFGALAQQRMVDLVRADGRRWQYFSGGTQWLIGQFIPSTVAVIQRLLPSAPLDLLDQKERKQAMPFIACTFPPMSNCLIGMRPRVQLSLLTKA